MKPIITLAAEYGIFPLKINRESQYHTCQVEVDQQYRILQYATEWKLHPELFHKIIDKVRELGIQEQRLWQLMPSVSSGITNIFTIFRLLV